MLSEGKTGKYIKYSIGEIILVVIGILIALSINNWNEGRKQKLVEINILNGIKSDILQDTIDINYNIRAFKTIIKTDSLLIAHFNNNGKNTPQIASLLHANFSYAENIIILHHSHFDQAKQEGLSIISNRALRDSISRLYEFHYNSLEQVEQEIEMFNAYSNVISNKLVNAFEMNNNGVLSLSDAFYDELVHDDNFIYLLNMHMYFTTVKYMITYTPALTAALTIVDEIDKELMHQKNN